MSDTDSHTDSRTESGADPRAESGGIAGPVAAAGRRLTAALDALEEAAERRGETDRHEEALATQIHALGTDRARLAGELDAAAARSRGLESANREAAERIAQAVATIRGVLETD